MTTLTDFVPEKGFHLTAERFANHVPQLDFHEKAKNIKFFEDNVRKGCYGNYGYNVNGFNYEVA